MCVGLSCFPRLYVIVIISPFQLGSGLQQDRLAFRVDLGLQDSLVLKVAKPSELRSWLESFEKVRHSKTKPFLTFLRTGFHVF